MRLIQLEVENGQNAHNSIDTQNGNIYWLRNIFGQPFRNQNNVIIDESLIQKRDNVNPDGEQLIYFTSAKVGYSPSTDYDIALTDLYYNGGKLRIPVRF